MKKTKSPTGEKILEEFVKLMSSLGLKNYDVSAVYEGEKGYEAKDATMAVSVNTPYRDVTIHISNKAIKIYEKDNTQIQIYLLHEIFHVLHWKYAELAVNRYVRKEELDNEEESLADSFAIMFNRILCQKKKS